MKAQPGASRNGVRAWANGMLRVSVTQVAEKGKANRVLQAVIAKDLGLRKSQVELIGGKTNSQKRFLIREITIEECVSRLHAVLGGDPK